MRFRASEWSASRGDPLGFAWAGHSMPGQVWHGENCSLCDLDFESDRRWRWRIWAPSSHHYLSHSRASSPDLQRLQKIRYFIFDSGRYFKKPELRYGCYFGGVPIEENEADFKDPNKTPHIIIATPGRLYDLAHRKLIEFEKVCFSWCSANTSWLTNATRCWATQKWEVISRIFSSRLLTTNKFWCSVLLCPKKWKKVIPSKS